MIFFVFRWLLGVIRTLNAGLVPLPVVDMDNGDCGWVQLTALYYIDNQLFLDGSYFLMEHENRVFNTRVSKALYGWEVKLPPDTEHGIISRYDHRQNSIPCEVYIL